MLLTHSIALRSRSPGRDTDVPVKDAPHLWLERAAPPKDAGYVCEEMALLIAQLRNSSALPFLGARGGRWGCWGNWRESGLLPSKPHRVRHANSPQTLGRGRRGSSQHQEGSRTK